LKKRIIPECAGAKPAHFYFKTEFLKTIAIPRFIPARKNVFIRAWCRA